MTGLRALGAVSEWLVSTALRVVGIGSHGVDPKGGDYLFQAAATRVSAIAFS